MARMALSQEAASNAFLANLYFIKISFNTWTEDGAIGKLQLEIFLCNNDIASLL